MNSAESRTFRDTPHVTCILFVCLGNICRSPAGENTMRHLLQQEGIKDVSLDSAGTAGYHIGKGPDPRMTATLESRNMRVTGQARQFSKKDFANFDLIIPMDEDNRRDILRLARNDDDRAKVKPFMSFCENFSNPEVPDPYYGGQEGFDLVADIMAEVVPESYKAWLKPQFFWSLTANPRNFWDFHLASSPKRGGC